MPKAVTQHSKVGSLADKACGHKTGMARGAAVGAIAAAATPFNLSMSPETIAEFKPPPLSKKARSDVNAPFETLSGRCNASLEVTSHGSVGEVFDAP
jgi:hypothetical protein